MPKITPFASNLELLLTNNTAYANVGDAGGLQPSATAGNFYISLHTGDPGLTGDQTVNEANYTGYARQPVARGAAGFTVSAGSFTNFANIVFGPCTGGTNTITWYGVGTAVSGVGQLLYAFPLISTYYDFVAQVSGNLFYNNSPLATLTPIQLVTNPGGALPGGFAQGVTYFVATVTGTNFTVSATSGGGAITVLSAGSGLLGQISSLVVSPGITPEFLAGQLVLYEV